MERLGLVCLLAGFAAAGVAVDGGVTGAAFYVCACAAVGLCAAGLWFIAR